MSLLPDNLHSRLSAEGFVQRYDSVGLITQPISEKKIPLIHLSRKPLRRLTARIPKGFFTQSGDEEAVTKRISMTSRVDLALMALGTNIEFQEFYIHEPMDYQKLRYIPNEVLVEHRLVPDAHHSDESWVIRPYLDVVCTGKIKVGRADSKRKPVSFFYHDVETEKRKRAKTYFWNWEWAEAYHITFLPSEHRVLTSQLRNDGRVMTTRVGDELTKYHPGDILTTNFTNRKLKVMQMNHYDDVNRHPSPGQLNPEQKKIISQGGKFTVLWLGPG